MLNKVLVANRGEIAIRIVRACRELGIASVAVYSEADSAAPFTRYADEAYCIGPAPATESYLDVGRVLEAARACGADAVHPGYGFLAENPGFAAACEAEGLTFVGPPGAVLALVGDKVAARRELSKAGVPVVPGTDESVREPEHARSVARDLGFPLIVKPAGGGGGIGMTVVTNEEELARALESSRALAATTFGLPDVYVERYLHEARHIEFQILADAQGRCVHLGERECSIQRRHQKLIEEAPSTAVTPALRREMGEVAVRTARWVGYEGAGTVEFLVSDGRYYFLEVNARVQVEHPVTEMVTAIDIVREQIRIASGLPLEIGQDDVRLNGWAIECRINAEDPLRGFAPSPGTISSYRPPGGLGVRVDDGVCAGYAIPPFYDSLIAKLIAWGRDRDEAISRMRRALDQYVVAGIQTNIPFHQAVLRSQRFERGELGTDFIGTETALFDEIARIAGRERAMSGQPSSRSQTLAKVAAISAVAAIARARAAAEDRGRQADESRPR